MAQELLKSGYDDYISLLKHRNKIAGNIGGAPSGALNNVMGNYPWAEFNFFHTFNSATGLDISKEWPYVPYFLHYILWNWLPGEKMYGYGDVYHITNNLPLGSMHIHLSQMIHFYGETHPDLISLAKWMLPKVQKQQTENIPFARFLLTNSHDEIKPQGPPENMSKAKHFDNMGQIFMRSGSGPDDTYALFTAGGILTQHRHYDNNNFVIFKKGFLAMDTGTRPEPGLHLPFYYARTVAHNCITIKMPGEEMPRYWGLPSLNEQPEPPHPNDGGQNNLLGSKIIAFDEKEEYAYIASDATESYHKDKADLVLRQFVFLPPDHFVVFDRVNSTKPEYKKRWLLHTATEPVIKGNEFYADHWEGRLFCKTLFPENAVLTKIGGPGKQFWSDGRNWPMPVLTPEDWGYERRHRIPPDTLDMLGQWRIEVTPDKPDTKDIFLHLIQVRETSLKSMVDSELIKSEEMVGVRFTLDDKEYEVMFTIKDEAGGKISINQDGRKILDEKFSDQVKKQQGLF
ncbi:MAG: heparinase II/III domain-containing protein [Bacteroidales bacterium]